MQQKSFKLILEQYYNMNQRTKDELLKYKIEAERNSQLFINNLLAIEKKLGMHFPDKYIELISNNGLSGFENTHFQIYLYDEKDIYEFNLGESSIDEMRDYLCFGQDGGSYTYFFDPNNILQNGKDAVYRIDRGVLRKEYFNLIADDIFDLFDLLVSDKEVNDQYLSKKKDNLNHIHNKDRENANIILERLSKSRNEKIEEMIKNIYSTLPLLSGYDLGHNFDNEEFYILKDIETHNNYKIPIEYQHFLFEFRGGGYWTDNRILEFYVIDALKEFNLENACKIKEFSKNFLIIGSTDDHRLLFIDPTNTLGNGTDIIYSIHRKAKNSSEAILLASNIIELFRNLADNKI